MTPVNRKWTKLQL